MSTYEEFMVILTVAMLIIAILNYRISKPPCLLAGVGSLLFSNC